MPRLVPPGPDQLAGILEESVVLWGGGLSEGDYRGLWDDLRTTVWGSRHARMLVHQAEDGRVLSSLKLYDPLVRIGDRTGRAAVIGALFTPVAERGRGRASTLVRDVLGRARDAGSIVAMLFSDIGTGLYERLGFVPLEAHEQWADLRRPTASTGPWTEWSIVPERPEDREAIRRAHDAGCRRRRFAVVRDDEHWDFLERRSRRFFERLAEPRLRLATETVFQGDRFVGYLISLFGFGEWNLREVGAVDGDPRAIADVLRRGAVAARAAGAHRFYGWLPPEVVPLLDDWRLRGRARQRAVPMLRVLEPGIDLRELDDAVAGYVPFQDQF